MVFSLPKKEKERRFKMTREELIKIRSQLKSRKPKFKRPQTNQFAKLKNSDKWRKPKGMGNKVRRRRRGHIKMPSVGYGSPSLVRNLNKEGFKEVIINNLSDLQNITSKEEIAIIGSTVGAKKKLTILTEIKKKNMSVGNVKDIDKKIKELTKVKKVKTEKKVETKTNSKEKKVEEKVKKETKTTTDKTQDKKTEVNKK